MKNPNATATGNTFRNEVTFILTNTMKIKREHYKNQDWKITTKRQILTRSVTTCAYVAGGRAGRRLN
jgi:hypothetical protein